MKTAVAILETELSGLKRQRDRLLSTQDSKGVKSVCFDLEKGGAVPMTTEQFYNKLLEITDEIRRVEDQLVIARGALDDSQKMIRKTANDLKDEDRTLMVFQKSVVEGKSITACATEMSVSPQTVSYHRTLIYRMIGSEDSTAN